MEAADLAQLLTPEGMALLDDTPAVMNDGDVLRTVTRLRVAGHDPRLVATVLTQARLRQRAVAKFGDFASRMLFTEAGLEQATRLQVAAQHAGRFQRAGITRVADLGCGIGGDALAFAALDLDVVAVDRDEVTAAITTHNLAPWPNALVELGDAGAFDLSRVDGVWLDPARRTAGHSDTRRMADPDDWSPSLDTVFATATTMPTGVKLGPGVDRDLIPDTAEAQWTSVDREVVELALWFGPLARPGIRRAATVIGAHGIAEMTGAEDAEDVEVGPLGDYLHEPDGAVIRARLIGDLARTLGGRMLSDGIAYVTGDRAVSTPFAQTFRVREVLPLDPKRIGARLAEDGVGRVEIKKRGVDVDPAEFRKRLRLRGGSASATLVLTRLEGRHTAILCDRVTETVG
ncbi:class I SAM-dependent methyltransferase [Curtobacterium sp. Leaf261]|uniref:class I SAM-dependent methyltransferase n=1 Tax=Curtobacterium sp. Leaf261 TaxID=1736311 RepID=UPI0006FAC5D4|nr:class I SAM-dependent methyltransferase [Curtobacterium sp. Leaf261]KQO63578.1 SAM-dependent methyltransferase [Curtobacterium sp. Leaf261]